MQIPRIKGIIERRILINYQIDHDVLASYLPKPFKPKLVNGKGIAGICLIRLKDSTYRLTQTNWHVLGEWSA